jgi:acetoin utilization deacetylase AcuC-like enzyme
MVKKTGIVRDRKYMEHWMGEYHPESPMRLEAIYAMLDEPEMAVGFAEVPARKADKLDIMLVHSPGYVERIESTAGVEYTYLDPDTQTCAASYDAAVLAAGGLCQAIGMVCSGELDNAFALVRPPGHHAERAQAKGFCLFNNVAVGAKYAQESLGVARIAIVDWDLHHGNGTQEAFYEDRQVLYFSTHQSPAYPGTGGLMEMGKDAGFGYTLNVPLSPGADDALYVRLFRDILSPIALAFRPEIILVSAGFDTYVGDPLGAMEVTPEGFACMTRILLDLADECCGGRLAVTLEGGYNIQGQTKSVRAVLLELLGETRVTEETLLGMVAGTDEKASRVVRRVREQFEPHWPVLRNER